MIFALITILHHQPNLESEGAPLFKYDDFSPEYDPGKHFDLNTIIDSQSFTNSKRNMAEFYTSSIEIRGSKFNQCYAFGNEFSGPSGGAIFTYCSQLLISHSYFTQNQAVDGGSIAIIYTNAQIYDDTFDKNIAFQSGGAISIYGTTTLEPNPSTAIENIINVNFRNNTAHSQGGAVYISLQGDAYFQDCEFSENSAGIHGGAVLSSESSCQFFSCKFQYNSAGKSLVEDNPKENSKLYTMSSNIAKNRFAPRGCGGIAFSAFLEPTKDQKEKSLSIDSCCFYRNIMINGYYDNKKAYKDIIADGLFTSSMISTNFSESDSYAFINKTNFHEYQNQVSSGECISGLSGPKNDGDSTLSISLASKIRSLGSSTSSVPEPTIFTYVATPITRLPNPTTKSRSYVPTSINLSTIYNFTRKSIPPATPFSTPSSTLNPTRSISPSRSVVPTQSKPVASSGSTASASTIYINSTTFVNVSVNTSTFTSVLTFETVDGELRSKYVNSKTYLVIWVLNSTYFTYASETYIIIPLEEPSHNIGGGLTSAQLIILSTIGCAVVFCLAVIGLFLFRKLREPTTPSSVSDMSYSESLFGDEITRTSSKVFNIPENDDNQMLTTTIETNPSDVFDDNDEDNIYLNAEF